MYIAHDLDLEDLLAIMYDDGKYEAVIKVEKRGDV